MRLLTRLIILSVVVMTAVVLVSPLVAPLGQRCSTCHTGSNPSGGYLFRLPTIHASYPLVAPPNTTINYTLQADHAGNYVVKEPRAAAIVGGAGQLSPEEAEVKPMPPIPASGGSSSATWTLTTGNSSGILYINTTLQLIAHLRHTNTRENDESPYMLSNYAEISVRPVAMYATISDLYLTTRAGSSTSFELVACSDTRNITLVPSSNIGEASSIVPQFIRALSPGERQRVEVHLENSSSVVNNGRIDITWENLTGAKDRAFVMLRILEPTPPPAPTTSTRWTGRITGLLSLGLLITSLVLGLVKWGGVRRARVHCAVSWFILGLSVYHGILLVLGPYSTIWLGNWVLLGYISAAVMGVSSVNGLVQDWMTRKAGYRAWIWTHRATVITAIVLVLIHAILMGTDFAFLRDQFRPGKGGPDLMGLGELVGRIIPTRGL